MQNPILGEVSIDDGIGVVGFQYGESKIQIRIMPDGEPFESSINLAEQIAEDLATLDDTAKRIAASQLTEKYNGGWNEYDEAQEDGTFKTVVNPALTEDEFVKKLTLTAINVTGDSMLAFFYNDENMFWGHSVIVNSMNGTRFDDADAQIFG